MSRYIPGRNDPCRCGSGRKYKKCCLRKVESIMETKKNTFRDEANSDIAGSIASPAEEMKRNQAVNLVCLKMQREMVEMDAAHMGAKISVLVANKAAVLKMPDCEWKVATLSLIENHIHQHGKALEASVFGIQNEMALENLEAVAALDVDKEGGVPSMGIS